MKRKNLLIVLAVLLFVPALSFALPHLAVLEAVLDSGIDPSAGPLVTSKIEEAFVNSGKYVVLDRANIDRVLQEKEFQLSSGIVRNEEVRQAGEYLGADAVVVASVSRIGQTYVVSAKMIDVVSGEIAAQTSAEKSGRIDVLLEVARMVGGRLAGTDIFIVSVDEQRAQDVVKDKPKEEPPQVEEEPEVVEEEPQAEEPTEPWPPRKRPWEKNFIIGVRGGYNGSTIVWEDYFGFPDGTVTAVYDPYGASGLNLGFYMVSNLGRFLALQFELDLSQKGYSHDYEEDFAFDVTETVIFNYLEVPMLVKLKIPGSVSPYAILGLYVALWLGGVDYKEYVDYAYEEEYDLDVVEANAIDAGWVGGVGLDLFVGSLVLNLEVKYSGGVLDVTDLYPFKNSTLSITGGIGLAF